MNLGFFLNLVSSQRHFLPWTILIITSGGVGGFQSLLWASFSLAVWEPSYLDSFPTPNKSSLLQLQVLFGPTGSKSLTSSALRHAGGWRLVAPCVLSEHVGTVLILSQALSNMQETFSSRNICGINLSLKYTHTLERWLVGRDSVPLLRLVLPDSFSVFPICKSFYQYFGSWLYHLLIDYVFTAAYINIKNLALGVLKIQPVAIQKVTHFARVRLIVYFDTKVECCLFLSLFR